MKIFPAIDLINGRCVRLHQGDYAQETAYSDDPIGMAKEFAATGARYLHVVDLDGAKQGKPCQLALIGEIAKHSGLIVQSGGGLRSAEHVSAMLDAGVRQVVIGSLAVQNPTALDPIIDRFGGSSLTIAVDVRVSWGNDATPILATQGWQGQSTANLYDLIAYYRERGVQRFLCTDIGRDGTLQGPALDLYRSMIARCPGIQLQASGGISSLADIRELRKLGAESAIIGKALYERKFSLTEALQC